MGKISFDGFFDYRIQIVVNKKIIAVIKKDGLIIPYSDFNMLFFTPEEFEMIAKKAIKHRQMCKEIGK